MSVAACGMYVPPFDTPYPPPTMGAAGTFCTLALRSMGSRGTSGPFGQLREPLCPTGFSGSFGYLEQGRPAGRTGLIADSIRLE